MGSVSMPRGQRKRDTGGQAENRQSRGEQGALLGFLKILLPSRAPPPQFCPSLVTKQARLVGQRHCLPAGCVTLDEPGDFSVPQGPGVWIEDRMRVKCSGTTNSHPSLSSLLFS